MECTTLTQDGNVVRRKARRLSAEDEVRLAIEHRSSRKKFAELIRGLPPVWRTRLLEQDPDGPAQGDEWPLGQLEIAYERLLECGSGRDGGALAITISEARRLKQSIDRSREQLVVSNLGLVPHIAKHYANRGIAFADLVQEGSIGLIKAVERFDCDRGYRFSTYAVWWIRQALSRAILERSRMIRLSRKTWDSVIGVKRAAVELTRQFGRRPTQSEIARHADLPEPTVVKYMALGHEPGPIEECGVELERKAAPRDEAEPFERVLQRERRGHLIDSLGDLSPKEQRLLRLRFGIDCDDPRTLEEIGRIFGVSRERVRQLEKVALQKLREALTERLAAPRTALGRTPMRPGRSHLVASRPARTRRDLKRLRAGSVDEGGKTSERGSSPQPLRTQGSDTFTFAR